MTMGVVASDKYLDGGFMAAPDADVTDGLLDIVVMKDSGSLKMLDELVNVEWQLRRRGQHTVHKS